MKSVRSCLNRAIALTVVVCFMTTQIVNPSFVRAQIPLIPQKTAFQLPFNEIKLPENIGQIEEFFIPPAHERSQDKLIAYIQTAHANQEASKNIESILERLTDVMGKSLIALEGADQPLKPEIIKIFDNSELNSSLAENLLKEGQLTGAEMFAIKHPERGLFVGVDQADLYSQNLKNYRKAYRLRGDSLKWISHLNRDLRELKNRIFSKELKEFDRSREAFNREVMSTYDYLVFLSRWALDKGIIDLDNPMEQKRFPMLVRILTLKRTAAAMNNFEKKLQEEVGEITNLLKEGGVDAAFLLPLTDLPDSLPKGSSRHYFEELFRKSLESDSPVMWRDYPAFRTFTEYSILQEEIDGVRFFKEIHSLEEFIIANLGLGKRERIILQLSQDAVLLERIFRLEASREEVGWFKKKKDRLTPERIQKRLQDIGSQFTGFNARLNRIALNQEQVLKAMATAETFYDLAVKRDSALLQNTLRWMKQEELDRAVLITGGFHSQGIRQLMRQRKLPYIFISPRITSGFGTENYEEILMGDHFDRIQSRTRYQKVEVPLLLQDFERFREMDPESPTRQFTEVSRAALEVLAEKLPKPIQIETLNQYLEQIDEAEVIQGEITVYPIDEATGEIFVVRGEEVLIYKLNTATGWMQVRAGAETELVARQTAINNQYKRLIQAAYDEAWGTAGEIPYSYVLDESFGDGNLLVRLKQGEKLLHEELVDEWLEHFENTKEAREDVVAIEARSLGEDPGAVGVMDKVASKTETYLKDNWPKVHGYLIKLGAFKPKEEKVKVKALRFEDVVSKLSNYKDSNYEKEFDSALRSLEIFKQIVLKDTGRLTPMTDLARMGIYTGALVQIQRNAGKSWQLAYKPKIISAIDRLLSEIQGVIDKNNSRAVRLLASFVTGSFNLNTDMAYFVLQKSYPQMLSVLTNPEIDPKVKKEIFARLNTVFEKIFSNPETFMRTELGKKFFYETVNLYAQLSVLPWIEADQQVRMTNQIFKFFGVRDDVIPKIRHYALSALVDSFRTYDLLSKEASEKGEYFPSSTVLKRIKDEILAIDDEKFKKSRSFIRATKDFYSEPLTKLTVPSKRAVRLGTIIFIEKIADILGERDDKDEIDSMVETLLPYISGKEKKAKEREYAIRALGKLTPYAALNTQEKTADILEKLSETKPEERAEIFSSLYEIGARSTLESFLVRLSELSEKVDTESSKERAALFVAVGGIAKKVISDPDFKNDPMVQKAVRVTAKKIVDYFRNPQVGRSNEETEAVLIALEELTDRERLPADIYKSLAEVMTEIGYRPQTRIVGLEALKTLDTITTKEYRNVRTLINTIQNRPPRQYHYKDVRLKAIEDLGRYLNEESLTAVRRMVPESEEAKTKKVEFLKLVNSLVDYFLEMEKPTALRNRDQEVQDNLVIFLSGLGKELQFLDSLRKEEVQLIPYFASKRGARFLEKNSTDTQESYIDRLVALSRILAMSPDPFSRSIMNFIPRYPHLGRYKNSFVRAEEISAASLGDLDRMIDELARELPIDPEARPESYTRKKIIEQIQAKFEAAGIKLEDDLIAEQLLWNLSDHVLMQIASNEFLEDYIDLEKLDQIRQRIVTGDVTFADFGQLLTAYQNISRDAGEGFSEIEARSLGVARIKVIVTLAIIVFMAAAVPFLISDRVSEPAEPVPVPVGVAPEPAKKPEEVKEPVKAPEVEVKKPEKKPEVVPEQAEIPDYQFGRKFRMEDMNDPAKMEEFIRYILKYEGEFHKPGIAYDGEWGLTGDGHDIDFDSGTLRGSARNWSASSKEMIQVAILVQALAGNEKAQYFLSSNDPSKAKDIALDILRKKIASYEKFNRDYPGYGGFLPWFLITSEGMKPTKHDTQPKYDWRTRVPSLDNGQLAWALMTLVDVLKANGERELARRYQVQLEMMAKNAHRIFYDPAAGKIRAEAYIADNQMTPEQLIYRNNRKGYFLDDPYEGELFFFFWALYGNPPQEAIDKVIRSKRLNRIEFRTNKGVITIREGHWLSSHEEWNWLVLPYNDVDLLKRILRNIQAVKILNSNKKGIPGLFASMHDAVTGNKNPDYLDGFGVKGADGATQKVVREDIITPYAAFPVILVDPAVGLAWYHNMINAPKMQGPYGSSESISTDGLRMGPLLTWDAKLLTVLALIGGIDELTRERMKADGTYDEFIRILTQMYEPEFGDKPLLGEDIPLVFPSTSIPRVLPEFKEAPPKLEGLDVLIGTQFEGEGTFHRRHAFENGMLIIPEGDGFIWNRVANVDIRKNPVLNMKVRIRKAGKIKIEIKNKNNDKMTDEKIILVTLNTRGKWVTYAMNIAPLLTSSKTISMVFAFSDSEMAGDISLINFTPKSKPGSIELDRVGHTFRAKSLGAAQEFREGEVLATLTGDEIKKFLNMNPVEQRAFLKARNPNIVMVDSIQPVMPEQLVIPIIGNAVFKVGEVTAEGLTIEDKRIADSSAEFAGRILPIGIQDSDPARFEKMWRYLFSKEIAGGNAVSYLTRIAEQNPKGPVSELVVRNQIEVPSVVVSTGTSSSAEGIVTQLLANPAEAAVIVEVEGGLTKADLENFLETAKALSPLQKEQVLNRIIFIDVPAYMDTAERINEVISLDEEFKIGRKKTTLRDLWKSRVGKYAGRSSELDEHLSVTVESTYADYVDAVASGNKLSFVVVPNLDIDVKDESAYRFMNYAWASTLAFHGGYESLPESMQHYLTYNQQGQLVLSDYALVQYLNQLYTEFQGLQKTLQAA